MFQERTTTSRSLEMIRFPPTWYFAGIERGNFIWNQMVNWV